MNVTEERGKRALLDGLNPVQRAAVEQVDGPVLIHAGAGSGKTRVLTHRVAYLIECARVRPSQILAVTFTNKAAAEMKERIQMLSDAAVREMWVGTFHSIAARILRSGAEKLGYQRNFLIFDRDDQIRSIKGVMETLHIQQKEHSAESILSAIGKAKNGFVSADDYKRQANDAFEEVVALVYAQYQVSLKQNNAMDFDDLLVNPIYLFEKDPEVLERYRDKFWYLLVDEYQDTNRVQYLFLKKLAIPRRNLCVVGDDDQSIYRWRGADVQNILNMESDYPDCKVFRLEQNYRSTQNILDVANSVVRNNARRREKSLWTTNKGGDKATIVEVQDQISESRYIVQSIKSEMNGHGRNFSDFVVLYRTNAQSRAIEEGLRDAGIPYTIVGGVHFYARKEVKDVLAYLRLICNPNDSISFKRVLNFPLRGIGDLSLKKLEAFAKERDISLMEAAASVAQISTIATRTRKSILAFYNMVAKYSSQKNTFSAGELARIVVDEIQILRTLKEIGTEEAFMRAENVKELLSAIVTFTKTHEQGGLEDFLENVALVSDVDTWDDRGNAVTLMTLHSAKGLEFPVVYMTGLEEGLFPLSRTFLSDEELEEERRLFYVGATRAESKLYMLWAASRLRFGEYFQNMPSRFLKEIDDELVERQSMRRRTASPPRARQHTPAARRTGSTMPRYEDYSQERQPLYIGCEVKHPRFGLGKIVRMDGAGESMKITVRFYEAGEKRLLVKYANLEAVG